jgi:tryptophan synthase alpha chain
MGRLAEALGRAERERRAALVVYLCAGDPDLATTPRLIRAAAEAGADIIEVGMPFSDPTADGPVIQRASERALGRGTTLAGVFGAIREARASRELASVGVVLFGYYNPILSRGEAEVARQAKDVGVDGFLVVDLPPEEAGPLVAALRASELDFVPLVAPTTPDARVDAIARSAGPFLYYVSLTGVTGASAADLDAAAVRAREVRKRAGKPVAVGFGVKTPDDVRALAPHVDAVVVGSAMCQAIESAPTSDAAVAAVASLVRSLRAACGH